MTEKKGKEVDKASATSQSGEKEKDSNQKQKEENEAEDEGEEMKPCIPASLHWQRATFLSEISAPIPPLPIETITPQLRSAFHLGM